MLRQLVPLLAPPPETHDVMRLQPKIDRLRRKRRQKINARHMYIGALIKMSAEVKRRGRHVLADISSRIVRKHGSLWKAMPAENKRLYHMAAEQKRFVKSSRSAMSFRSYDATFVFGDIAPRRRNAPMPRS
jgi:hypothetical protein